VDLSLVRTLKSRTIKLAKRLAYGSRGEPYVMGPHRVRFIVGTRPIRLKYVDAKETVSRNDARQVQFFLNQLRPGQTVYDIGAHYGEYAVLLAALVGPQGRVVSFEPDVAAQPVLRDNLRLNGFTDWVRVESCAISDNASTQTLFARHGDSKSSLARAGLGGSSSDVDVERYDVAVVRLDDYVQASCLPKPDIIKLDVEGAEINVLRGAGEILRSGTVIVCELHPYAWRGFDTTFDELLRLAANAGRVVRYLDPKLKIGDGGQYGAVIIS
jgi:FkbM family methyltransferase